ncbi:MAG: chemotaxis protein CheX [Bacteroidales bacterium]
MTLTEKQQDYLTEIINIGIGRSAEVLNRMVHTRVRLHVPKIHVVPIPEMEAWIDRSSEGPMSMVSMGFKGKYRGNAALLLTSSNARKIVDLLTNKEYKQLDMDQLRSSTLNEVGNIVLNSLIGTLGNLLDLRFRYSIPQFVEGKGQALLGRQEEAGYLIYAETQFNIKSEEISGSFLLFFELDSQEAFLEELNKHLD